MVWNVDLFDAGFWLCRAAGKQHRLQQSGDDALAKKRENGGYRYHHRRIMWKWWRKNRYCRLRLNSHAELLCSSALEDLGDMKNVVAIFFPCLALLSAVTIGKQQWSHSQQKTLV